MKLFPVIVLVLCGIGFLGFGLWLLLDPVGGLSKVDISATSKVGQIELRAFYGGLEIGLGAFLIACAMRAEWQVAGLWLVLLGNGGCAIARLIGIALAGTFSTYLGCALTWELGFTALAALALRKA
jgi:hypothetical protein